MGRILVTGGAGFIGSHICVNLLKKGYEIIVIDSLINSSLTSLKRVIKIVNLKDDINKKISFINCDIRERKGLNQIFLNSYEEGKPIEGVIHLAGLKSVEDSLKLPIDYWDCNVNGTINLINVMNNNNCKLLVFSSSATIYGFSENYKIDENSFKEPKNPYGSTKFVIEYFLNELFKSNLNEWRIINLRYFNPIGAHPSGLIGESPIGKPNNIFPSITQIASGKRKILNIFGNDWPTKDGTCIRDFIHVMDLADGHISALEYLKNNKPLIKEFNLGTGIGTSVLELINTFQKVNNIEIPYIFLDRRKGDIAKVIADNSLAIKELNWIPKRNLDDMCRDGWKWQKDNPYGYAKK